MRLRKATVQIVRDTSSVGYSLTLYMGIQCESGPTYPVLLTSLQDLYTYFNSFERTESFVTAELCLKWGYKVLAHRVSYVTGPSSSRKFLIDGKSKFYSPRYNKDYSQDVGVNISSTIGYEDQVFSEIFEFSDPSEFKGASVNSKFLLIVPRIVHVEKEGSRIFNAALAGSGWDETTVLSTFNVEPSMLRVMTPEEMQYSREGFIQSVLDFCEGVCNLSIEPIGGTDRAFFLESTTAMQSFDVRDATVSLDSPIKILDNYVSDVGKQDNYCYAYDNYKVATVYSKFPDALTDLQVEISSSYGNYYVIVYKMNSDQAVVYSESFQYSNNPSNPNYITRLNQDSRLVNITIYDDTQDLSGTYNLTARTYLNQKEDYDNSLSVLSDAESYQADVCLDMSGSPSYINVLRERFPNAVIMTGSFVEGVKIVNVHPKVVWSEYKRTLPGFTYLLYILPYNSEGSDYSVIKLEGVEEQVPTFVSTITQEDYDVTLMGVDSPIQELDNRLPVKSVLAVVAIQDLIVNTQFNSEEDFLSKVSQFSFEVQRYLNCEVYTNVDNLTISNTKLSATLTFHVDSVLISSYRITATFNQLV